MASLATDRWAGRLHLEIQPAAACWVSAIADGRQGLQRLMAAGEHETIDATDEVILLVGDSLACSFSINGIVAHQAGKAGQPATLRITRQNYRDFLNPADVDSRFGRFDRPTGHVTCGERPVPCPADLPEPVERAPVAAATAA